jgi:hypothetical protein
VNSSAATGAVVDINLSADAPVLTRTSASGATPYTVDAALASKTFAGYTLHRQLASDSGFGTLLYDGHIVLTEAMLQSPLTIDWTQATPVYSEQAGSQYYEQQRVEAYTPLGSLKTSPWSNTLSKTDGLAAMVLSTTDKTANVVISNGSLTFSDGGGGGPNTVRGSRAISPTLSYWEAKPTTATGTLRIGIADGSATITAWWSDGVHDAVYDKGGGLSFNGASNTYATYTSNDVIGFAVDIGASPKLWVAKNNTWQNGTPGVSGGQALTGITTSTLKPAVEGEFGNVVDFHFTSGSFVYTPPSGFTAP